MISARNVLIEEMSNFTFIEKSHQRVPMWNVFGDFTIKEGASVSVINTYMTTPSDNYNIYFKGTNQKFILDNPKYVNIYTKNATTAENGMCPFKYPSALSSKIFLSRIRFAA